MNRRDREAREIELREKQEQEWLDSLTTEVRARRLPNGQPDFSDPELRVVAVSETAPRWLRRAVTRGVRRRRARRVSMNAYRVAR